MIHLDQHEDPLVCGPALEPLRRAFEERPSIETHQQIVKDLVGSTSEDLFVFTSSGAEAINQVLLSIFLEVSREEGKCHFIASSLEDAPTMQMLKRLEDLGCFAKMVPILTTGEIDVAKLAEMISPRTALISITLAQGLTGVIQPIEEIAKLAKEKNVLLHVDASYAVGKIYFSFPELGADYLTFSGDLLHASKATGVLIAKKGKPLVPLVLGGKGLRGGPLDTPSFLSLSAAANQATLFLDRMSLEVARLRNLLEEEILRLIPDAKVLFRESFRLPNTTVISFARIHQEALLYLLDRKKIQASIGGSYCQHLSRILEMSQIDEATAQGAISFSLSRMTTEEEIYKAALQIKEAVKQLQAISEDL